MSGVTTAGVELSEHMFIDRVQCPVCGGADTVQIYSEQFVGSGVERFLIKKYNRAGVERKQSFQSRFAGRDYVIQSCRSCSALFQRYAPDDAFAAEYYDTWISEHESPMWGFSEFTHRINEALVLTSFLLRHTGKTSPAQLKVLDYGSGRGLFALAMRACGCSVATFDLSEGRNETARKNGLKVLAHDEIAGQELDFINTEQVFEHLRNPGEIARHLVRGLGERGVLKVSVPYARWLESGSFKIDWTAQRYARNSYMPLQPLEHLTYFRRPSLTIMAEQIGLRQVRLRPLDELNFAFEWRGLRNTMKNLARPFARDRFRNYYLFSR